jgi:hypothetical protein
MKWHTETRKLSELKEWEDRRKGRFVLRYNGIYRRVFSTQTFKFFRGIRVMAKKPLIKKLDKAWSYAVKVRAKNKCEVCGKPATIIFPEAIEC